MTLCKVCFSIRSTGYFSSTWEHGPYWLGPGGPASHACNPKMQCRETRESIRGACNISKWENSWLQSWCAKSTYYKPFFKMRWHGASSADEIQAMVKECGAKFEKMDISDCTHLITTPECYHSEAPTSKSWQSITNWLTAKGPSILTSSLYISFWGQEKSRLQYCLN